MIKIGIGVAIVAVLAVGGFFLLRQNASQIAGDSEKASHEKTSLAGLDTNSQIICNFDDGEFQTTAYIHQEKARVDGVSDSGNTSAIVSDNTVWGWDPATKEGFIMNFSDAGQEKIQDMMSSAMTRDALDEKIRSEDANCRNESFDSMLLDVPTDVTFQDMSEMMGEQMDRVDGAIPDEIKDQIPEEYRQYLPQ